MPERVQLSHAKGWRMPPNTVKVDRTTAHGNHFVIVAIEDGRFAVSCRPELLRFAGADGDEDTTFADTMPAAWAEAVSRFRAWLLSEWGQMRRAQVATDLRGKNLACWCKPEAACHADVLLELANKGDDK